MPTAHAISLTSHLEANASAITGLTTFWTFIRQWLLSRVTQARELIDTPEERAAVEAVVLAQYDKLLVLGADPKVAALALVFKPFVASMFDALLVALAG